MNLAASLGLTSQQSFVDDCADTGSRAQCCILPVVSSTVTISTPSYPDLFYRLAKLSSALMSKRILERRRQEEAVEKEMTGQSFKRKEGGV